jgi:hypothetical protein
MIEMKRTYHDGRGKFSSLIAARSVSSGGDRFVVIRSLRPAATVAADDDLGIDGTKVAETISRAKAQATMSQVLAKREGWIPVHEYLESIRTAKV